MCEFIAVTIKHFNEIFSVKSTNIAPRRNYNANFERCTRRGWWWRRQHVYRWRKRFQFNPYLWQELVFCCFCTFVFCFSISIYSFFHPMQIQNISQTWTKLTNSSINLHSKHWIKALVGLRIILESILVSHITFLLIVYLRNISRIGKCCAILNSYTSLPYSSAGSNSNRKILYS